MINLLFEKTNNLLSWWPSGSEGDMIVSQLPALFKSGSSLLQEGDLLIYFVTYVASIVFFALIFFFFNEKNTQ